MEQVQTNSTEKFMSLQKAMRRLGDLEKTEKAQGSLLEYARMQMPGYMWPSHIRLLAEKLEAVEKGEIKRLAIFMPPRHGATVSAKESSQLRIRSGSTFNSPPNKAFKLAVESFSSASPRIGAISV